MLFKLDHYNFIEKGQISINHILHVWIDSLANIFLLIGLSDSHNAPTVYVLCPMAKPVGHFP
ncbi:hypothetical protein ACJX0J_028592, partial [Zea mays]